MRFTQIEPLRSALPHPHLHPICWKEQKHKPQIGGLVGLMVRGKLDVFILTRNCFRLDSVIWIRRGNKTDLFYNLNSIKLIRNYSVSAEASESSPESPHRTTSLEGVQRGRFRSTTTPFVFRMAKHSLFSHKIFTFAPSCVLWSVLPTRTTSARWRVSGFRKSLGTHLVSLMAVQRQETTNRVSKLISVDRPRKLTRSRS